MCLIIAIVVLHTTYHCEDFLLLTSETPLFSCMTAFASASLLSVHSSPAVVFRPLRDAVASLFLSAFSVLAASSFLRRCKALGCHPSAQI